MNEKVIPFDSNPGRYCCIYPTCDHPRDQVFNGGSGEYE